MSDPSMRERLKATTEGREEPSRAMFPARPMSEWHEDKGPKLWWKFPVVEPPYSGSPGDDDFPDYVTHWTDIVVPNEPGQD
jgi:hypothetical protein